MKDGFIVQNAAEDGNGRIACATLVIPRVRLLTKRSSPREFLESTLGRLDATSVSHGDSASSSSAALPRVGVG